MSKAMRGQQSSDHYPVSIKQRPPPPLPLIANAPRPLRGRRGAGGVRGVAFQARAVRLCRRGRHRGLGHGVATTKTILVVTALWLNFWLAREAGMCVSFRHEDVFATKFTQTNVVTFISGFA